MSGSERLIDAESTLKYLLGDPIKKIKFDDYVTSLLKQAIGDIRSDKFRNDLPDIREFGIQTGLTQYETVVRDLLFAAILTGRWGQSDQTFSLENVISRFAEARWPSSGLTNDWLAFQWYPICLVIYAAGIAALASRNYPFLAKILQAKIISRANKHVLEPVIVRVLDEMGETDRYFKFLPEYEPSYAPQSEYIFTLLHPLFDRTLFLGNDYERLFDQFEMILALVHADATQRDDGRFWTKPGRFGYMARRPGGPFSAFVSEMEKAGDAMPLLKAGLFSSSTERFREVSKGCLEFFRALPSY